MIDASTRALVRDNSKCIKCRRCVTACTQVQGVGALFPQNRGFATVIGPAFTLGLADVDRLGHRDDLLAPMSFRAHRTEVLTHEEHPS